MQLHKEGIIHRDLKPENILVGFNWKVYLADFGFAIYEKELKKESQYARVGTLEFYPIEMLSPCFRKDKITYDHRVDIWSMGIIIYELLYSRTPFYTGNEVDTKARIRSLKFGFPTKKSSNNSTLHLAENLFRRIFVLPANRISLEEVLAHPWLAPCHNQMKSF
jgi:aurora kinase